MTLTAFPNGISVRGMPVLGGGSPELFSTGSVFFVDSVLGSDTQDGLDPSTALATIDAAVNKCTANKGDFVIVLPNHAENIIADSGVDIDIAGVTVVAMGTGEARATITFTTDVAADFKLAAADVTVKNILFKAGIDALTGPIEISADDCALVNCEYRDDAGNSFETVDVVISASTPLRMLIDGFKFTSDGDTGGASPQQSVIQLSGSDHAHIKNCWLVAFAAIGVIEDAVTSDSILIENCVIENQDTGPTVGILLTATTSGTMRGVHIRVASGTTYITATNDMQFYECYGVGVDSDSGEVVGSTIGGSVEGKIDTLQSDLNTADGSFITGLGRKVTKTADLSSDPDDLFDVTGKVLIMLMVGEVTTVVATTTTMQLKVKTSGEVMSAITTITTDADGTMYLVSGHANGLMNGGLAPTPNVAGLTAEHDSATDRSPAMSPMVVGNAGGSLTIELDLDAGGTGNILWELWYIPLEASATVVAAA